VQPAHHRADRHAEHAGSLAVAEAAQVDQLEHRPLGGGQRPESRLEDRVERAAQHGVLGSCRARRVPVHSVGVNEQLGASAPVSVAVGVAQDGEQPALRVAPVESAEAEIGAQQAVLDEVLGLAAFPGEDRSDPLEGGQVGQHPALEAVSSTLRLPHPAAA
jgi:hypothetical protein